mmetsp:Transcript_13015/g.35911  ORF Transcript_13015/g.35911 Transcript_13015/m.35911 type:complete len:90 (+) Transcript_13015:999-1268(+)
MDINIQNKTGNTPLHCFGLKQCVPSFALNMHNHAAMLRCSIIDDDKCDHSQATAQSSLLPQSRRNHVIHTRDHPGNKIRAAHHSAEYLA